MALPGLNGAGLSSVNPSRSSGASSDIGAVARKRQASESLFVSKVTDLSIVAGISPASSGHRNLFDNVTTTSGNEKSAVIDCQYVKYINIYGHINGTDRIEIENSENGVNFRKSLINSIVTVGAGFFETGPLIQTSRYNRLSVNTSGRTIWATLAGK